MEEATHWHYLVLLSISKYTNVSTRTRSGKSGIGASLATEM